MRVILAEDSTLLREGLVRLLAEEGHDVVAAVGDAAALLSTTAAHLPDVVVTDVRMPPTHTDEGLPPTHTDEGLRAALEIRRRFPGVGVLVLSQYVEQRYAVDLLTEHADGVGYLLKDRVAQVEEFLDALRRVGAGGAAFDPEVVRKLLARSAHPLGGLTDREREVLARMAEGHTNNAIATRLHISRSAVEKHVNSIFDKLELSGVDGYSRRVLAILRYLRA
ncbi:DNA-binding NarL/FixJ family response regulator [Saccharothrix coeruleofusca]|uniref:response regulator transcription factor n=1 Tax=Saccharothrix coeruleofusca TaxID=33919 RepID=UPI001AE61B48|nr:response regulator transcription factor [Saccharothrix coeruleofusca]MBP2334007.1 DNA-binding NarL/FixJ family response regulator [Saccharothrix coeruleofusca]